MGNNTSMVPKKKSRAEQMSGMFKITSFIHRYQLFKPFLYLPTSILNAIGTILAPIALKSRRLKARLDEGLDFLFSPFLTPKRKNELYNTNIRYMVQMYLDAIFHSPNIYAHTLSQFITFEGLAYLYDALKKGNGVIIPTVHTGMYFHILAGLAYLPDKNPVVTVVRPRNQTMYENIINRPELRHFFVLPTSKFDKIKSELLNHLQSNHIVVAMFDYSKKRNLRVPFWEEKFPQLITTPQSTIRLHSISGAVLIPAVIEPDGEVGKSIVRFLDPDPIQKYSSSIAHLPQKDYHGRMSIYLNNLFAPFLVRYAHYWEELRKFTHRMQEIFDYDEIGSIYDHIDILIEKMKEILDLSFETNRRDDAILNSINEFQTSILQSIGSTVTEMYREVYQVDLSKMTSYQKITILKEKIFELVKRQNQISPELTLLFDKFEEELNSSYLINH